MKNTLEDYEVKNTKRLSTKIQCRCDQAALKLIVKNLLQKVIFLNLKSVIGILNWNFALEFGIGIGNWNFELKFGFGIQN